MDNEYIYYQDAAAADTNMDHNAIDTTSLYNILGRLTLFLSTKSVLVTMTV